MYLSLRSKLLFIYLPIALVVVGLVFSARPVYRYFKEIRASVISENALNRYLENPTDLEAVNEVSLQLRSALALDPDGYAPNRGLAIVLNFTSPAVARQYWEQAIEYTGDQITIQDRMAYVQCLIVNNDFLAAEQELLKVLEQDPNNVDAQYNLSKIYVLIGQETRALEYARDFIQSADTPIERHLFYIGMCLNSDDPSIIAEGDAHIEFLLDNSDLINDQVMWQMTEIDALNIEIKRRLQDQLQLRVDEFEDEIRLVNHRIQTGVITRNEGFEYLMGKTREADNRYVTRLAEWCSDVGLAEQVPVLLSVPLALQRKDWFLILIRNLGRLERWDAVVRILEEEQCPIERFWLYILKVEAYRAMDSDAEMVNAWYRAKLEALPLPLHFWTLIEMGNEAGLNYEADALLDRLVILGVPAEEILGYGARLAHESRNFDRLYTTLTSFYDKYGGNPDIANDWAYYSILMDQNGGEAREVVETLSKQYPNRLRYHMTWALGRIKDSRYSEVLARFQTIDVEWETLHPKWRLILAFALAGVDEFQQAQYYLEGVDMEQFNEYERAIYERLFYNRT